MSNPIQFYPKRPTGCSLAVIMLCNKTAVTSDNIKIKWEDECFVLKSVGVEDSPPTPSPSPSPGGKYLPVFWQKLRLRHTHRKKPLWWIDQKSGKSSALDPIVISGRGLWGCLASRELCLWDRGWWCGPVWKLHPMHPFFLPTAFFSGCAFFTDNVSFIYMYL